MSDPLHPAHHVHETAPLHDPPDAWHDHSRDEKPQHAHAEVGNAPMVIGVGAALFIIICVAAVSVDAFYRGFASKRVGEMEALAAQPNSPAILARKERSDAYLYQQSSDPRWITLPGSGEVPTRQYAQIPHTLATEMMIRDYAGVINPAAAPPPRAATSEQSRPATAPPAPTAAEPPTAEVPEEEAPEEP